MATAIIIFILLMICIYSIKSYMKKLTPGCCGGKTESLKRKKPYDSNKKHYRYCLNMGIEGMSCQNCQRKIENIFNEKQGYYMEVNLSKHSAKLYTQDIVSKDEVKQIIVSIGYHVSYIQ